jgi:hypothetical protein
MEISLSPLKIKMRSPANWPVGYEFIPANSQMCYPDGKTTGVRAMYVRFLTPQGTGHGLGLLTIEAEIPCEDLVIIRPHIGKKPLLHLFPSPGPCIMRDVRCCLPLNCV